MKKKLFLPFLLFCLYIPLITAQVKGTVTDQDGETLIGATVTEKGTTNGVITNVNGEFRITLRSNVNPVLVVSYIGFETKETVVGNQTNLYIVLSPSSEALTEVVVTALGIKRDTRAIGYAISTIKGEDLIKAGITANPLATLYGKAAGVGVQATAAGPMGGMKINIRGAQGLESSSGTRPLFVVDGIPVYDSESSMASRNYNPLNSFDYGSAVNDINVDDIASMEILKGSKAAVLYGSLGANGVVLITTKSGAGTRGLGVQISYNQEWHKPYSLIDFQNEFGSGEHEYSFNYEDSETGKIRRTVSSRYNFGPKFDGSDIKFFDGSTRKYLPYENNYLDMFNSGSSYNVNAAIQGGNEKGNMRLSLSNYDYNGIIPNQSQLKNTLSFNGQYEVSKFARFEFIQNFYKTKSQGRMPNIQHMVAFGTYNRDYDIKTAMNAYKTEDGWMRALSSLQNIEKNWGWPAAFLDPNNINDGFFNMMWDWNENRDTDERLQSNTSGKAFFTFFPFLSLTLQGGMNYSDTDYTTKNMPQRQNTSTGAYEGGMFSFRRERNVIQNFDAFLTFNKKFINNKLDVNVFGGPSFLGIDYTNINVGTRGNSKFPGFWSLENADRWPASYDSFVSGYRKENEAIYSVQGNGTISWGYEYILEFQARNDWASTLPKVHRSYFYPGASLTWNFTETFNIPKINYGKLFVSLADVGRPANRYFALRAYNMGTLPSPNTNINDVTGPSDLFSGDLKPERKREFEIGASLRMFNNRLEINPSYYNATWYNQIMRVPLSATTGAQFIRINAGEIVNQGFELFINGSLIATDPFRWEMSLTAARQWDKINKLYPGIPQVQESQGNVLWRKAVGERMNTLWVQDYAKDENGNKLVNDNGLYFASNDPKDAISLGSTNVDIYGGWSTNFYFQGKWGMLNLMGALDYKFGGKIISMSNRNLMAQGLVTQSLAYRNTEHGGLTWTEKLSDGTTRERHDGLMLPGMKLDGTPNDKIIAASYYYSSYINDMGNGWMPDMIKENSYVKFRELSVLYTFPSHFSKKLSMQKLGVGAYARNLFYLYKTIDNIDSEAMLGTGNDSWRENSAFPGLRTYGLKVNVSF